MKRAVVSRWPKVSAGTRISQGLCTSPFEDHAVKIGIRATLLRRTRSLGLLLVTPIARRTCAPDHGAVLDALSCIVGHRAAVENCTSTSSDLCMPAVLWRVAPALRYVRRPRMYAWGATVTAIRVSTGQGCF